MSIDVGKLYREEHDEAAKLLSRIETWLSELQKQFIRSNERSTREMRILVEAVASLRWAERMLRMSVEEGERR